MAATKRQRRFKKARSRKYKGLRKEQQDVASRESVLYWGKRNADLLSRKKSLRYRRGWIRRWK